MNPTPIRETQIRRHVIRYYRSLYRGEKPCAVQILQGWPLAVELGYPSQLQELVPGPLWSAFVPCGNPVPLLRDPSAGSGLNLGCGAGIDTLALQTARPPVAPVVNLDPVVDILEMGQRNLPPPSGANGKISWCAGEAENLPFSDGVFHWVVMNGVFSLLPNQGKALEEVRRVLVRNGQLVICDLFHEQDLPDYFRDELDAWAWCMSGSAGRSQVAEMLRKAGLHMECFEPQENMDLFCRATLSATRT